MTRIFLIFFCLSITLCSTAGIREVQVMDTAIIKVVYKRTIVLDTLSPSQSFKKDILTLFAGKRASAFYSEENRTDQEMQENPEYLLNSFRDPEMFKYLSGLEKEAIFRNYSNMTQIVHQRYDLSNWQLNEEIIQPKWIIQDSIINLMGFECIKATTHFRGREWTAFFSPEIPIPEGPWKLIGLPGIVLKAHDAKKEYCYEVLEIYSNTPGKVEYFNYRDRLIIKDRIKGLQHRYRVKNSKLADKIETLYGLPHNSDKVVTEQNKRYDFEETDYPHTI